jgi:hypothetical protein
MHCQCACRLWQQKLKLAPPQQVTPCVLCRTGCFGTGCLLHVVEFCLQRLLCIEAVAAEAQAGPTNNRWAVSHIRALLCVWYGFCYGFCYVMSTATAYL